MLHKSGYVEKCLGVHISICSRSPVRSLNISAITVLHICDIPPFRAHKTMAEMVADRESVALAVARSAAALYLRVQDVIQEPILPEWIRVPLDTRRENMRSLQWRPPCLKIVALNMYNSHTVILFWQSFHVSKIVSLSNSLCFSCPSTQPRVSWTCCNC